MDRTELVEKFENDILVVCNVDSFTELYNVELSTQQIDLLKELALKNRLLRETYNEMYYPNKSANIYWPYEILKKYFKMIN